MVGAVYALGVPWQEMYDFVLSINERTFFSEKKLDIIYERAGNRRYGGILPWQQNV